MPSLPYNLGPLDVQVKFTIINNARTRSGENVNMTQDCHLYSELICICTSNILKVTKMVTFTQSSTVSAYTCLCTSVVT